MATGIKFNFLTGHWDAHVGGTNQSFATIKLAHDWIKVQEDAIKATHIKPRRVIGKRP